MIWARYNRVEGFAVFSTPYYWESRDLKYLMDSASEDCGSSLRFDVVNYKYDGLSNDTLYYKFGCPESAGTRLDDVMRKFYNLITSGYDTYYLRDHYDILLNAEEPELVHYGMPRTSGRYPWRDNTISFDSFPVIKKAIFDGPATIILWMDGTKTVVRCSSNDNYDKQVGITWCILKKLLDRDTYRHMKDMVQTAVVMGQDNNERTVNEIMSNPLFANWCELFSTLLDFDFEKESE